jgi:hypothetical protein
VSKRGRDDEPDHEDQRRQDGTIIVRRAPNSLASASASTSASASLSALSVLRPPRQPVPLPAFITKTIDAETYPHLIDNIIHHASPDTLIAFSATCSEYRVHIATLVSRIRVQGIERMWTQFNETGKVITLCTTVLRIEAVGGFPQDPKTSGKVLAMCCNRFRLVESQKKFHPALFFMSRSETAEIINWLWRLTPVDTPLHFEFTGELGGPFASRLFDDITDILPPHRAKDLVVLDSSGTGDAESSASVD